MRQFVKAALMVAVFGLAGCETSLADQAPGWIEGRITNVVGDPIQASIEIGDALYQTDNDGRFSVTPDPALVYRLEVAADGHYAMRHTFSHAELMRSSTLPDIKLVEKKPDRTMFVFGGDAMIDRRFFEPHPGEPILVRETHILEDSKTLLKEMKPYLERADYASINLETPVFSEPLSEPAPKSVTFYSPPEILPVLEWAGTDYVALGNNHIYDYLEPGQAQTFELLEQSNLDYSGAGANEAEALRSHRATLNEFNYDFLSYVGWPAGPPTQSADSDKGGAALGTEQNMVETTELSRATNGIPVLQFHGGLEYVEEPTLSVETRVKRAADAGSPLIVAHHPHVTQGLELHGDTLIAWSLGNFLFDQYFYSAQAAALLYVWMDGDEVHYAETVPVYLKGYVPTPAVGPMREHINRRMSELSAKRGTHLHRSGGHLAVSVGTASIPQDLGFGRASMCDAEQARSGIDLLARGDFDSHALFGAPDRSWLDLDDAVTVRARPGTPHDFGLHIELSRGTPVTTGMRKFTRVFKKGTPMSVRMDVTTTQPIEFDIILQTRADGQALFDALEQGQRTKIGSARLSAGASQVLNFNFDSPRTRARSIRFLIEARTESDQASVVIDDLELIEWQTPYQPSPELCSE